MAQNRTIPYGYKIENGSVKIEPSEKDTVIGIYEMYINGNSYLQIANNLTLKKVRYIKEKSCWNKNMVARILQNNIYLGTEKYLKIIDESLFLEVQSVMKPYTITEVPEIKQLKPKLVCSECGKRIRRRIKPNGHERWFCPTDTKHIALAISDEVIISNILQVQRTIVNSVKNQDDDEKILSLEVVKIENEINRLLEQKQMNIAEVKSKIMQLAQLKYSICKDVFFLNPKLIKELEQNKNKINAELLDEYIEKIEISRNEVSKILLKNGQEILKGNESNE
ncbi:MAG: recombinase family protein [Clostridia bacterium]